MVDDIDGMYNDFYSIKNFYFSSTMGWDNSARRKKDYRVYCNYNPKSFYKWLRYTIREARRRLPEDKRYILVNAWNEWAEGTYLEPDKKYGYTNINTLSKAIYDIPMSDNNVIYLDKKKKISNKFKKKIAVQVHVYYIDIYLHIIELLKNFPYDIDLYITTTDKSINNKVLKIAQEARFKNVKVESYGNKGRDIYPFICQMSKVYKKYDFILKLHTKKTLSYDNDWCEYLLNNLIGDKYKIVTLLDYLDKNGGILYPVYYKSVLDMLSVGGNKNNIDELMNNMNFDISKIDLNSFDFPTGSMFYVESNILKELFEMDKGYMDKDFNNECIDGTYAHAIERIFGILPLIKNKKISLFKFK